MMMTTTPNDILMVGNSQQQQQQYNTNNNLLMNNQQQQQQQVHNFINDPNDWKLKLVSGQLRDEDLINNQIDSDDEGLYSEHQLTMDDDSDDDAFFGGRQRNSQIVITNSKHDLDSSSSDEEEEERAKSPKKNRSFRMGQDEEEEIDDTPSFQHVNSIRMNHPFYQKYGDAESVATTDAQPQQQPIIQQQFIPIGSPSSPIDNDDNNAKQLGQNHDEQKNQQELTTITDTELLSSESSGLNNEVVTSTMLGQVGNVEQTTLPPTTLEQQVVPPTKIVPATIITEVVEFQQPIKQKNNNIEDHHKFEIVTTTTIEDTNSTVQYTTTTVPSSASNLSNNQTLSSNPYASENDKNYALQQALKYSATVFDENSTEYIDDSFAKMESPFVNNGPKRSIIDPSTRVQPSQKKRVRFAENPHFFPITYINVSEKPTALTWYQQQKLQQQQQQQQQQFSIVTTISSPISPTPSASITLPISGTVSKSNNNGTTTNVATVATTGNNTPRKESSTTTTTTNNTPRKESSSTPSQQQATTKSQKSTVSFSTPPKQQEENTETIPSNHFNEDNFEKDDNSGNPNDNNEDDEFRTNDGKRRFWGLTGYQYLVLASAWLGWAFDIFDGVLFSYAAPICIPNLLGYPDDQITSQEAKEQTALWSSILSTVLLFGWGCGGIFFGWLTDKVGRSKTMMITIIVYSVGTFFAAFSFHISVLVILRFIASLGIGGEWSAGAALISETLPIEKRVIGGVLLYTAAPIGSMASFAVNYLVTSVLLQSTASPITNGTITNSTMLITDGIMSGDINAPVVTGGPIPLWLSWRILFAIGVVPTIVGICVRLCVKEPDAWLEQKKREKEEEEEENNIASVEQQDESNDTELPQTPPRTRNTSIVTASPAALETMKNEDSISLNSEDDLKEIDLNDQPIPPIRSESEFSSTSVTPLKKKRKKSSYLDLFANADLRKRTISAILFVCPALISWWCISTFIPILSTYLASSVEDANERKITQNQYSVLGNMLFNFGGLIGTLLVIPVATKLGRLWVYRIYFFCSTVFIIIAFGIPDMSPYVRFCLMFPVGLFVFGAFGSFTFYLPELFPMELRGRGAGFTYNCGRFGTAVFPFIVGFMVSQGVNPLIVLACLSAATAAGFIVSVIPKFAVETKNLIIH